MTGILDPEDLSAYATATSSNNIVSFGQASNGQDFNTIYTNLMTASGVRYHKSLDFSNVGMPTDNDGGDAAKRLRQFHQTRLYIMDYDGMLAHTKELNSEKDKNATYLISANLPETFEYRVGSEWSAPLSFGSEIGNALMQMGGSDALNKISNGINDVFGTDFQIGDKVPSLVNRVSTLQVWNGTKPLELSIKIPVIDDGHPANQGSSVGKHTNLVEALEFLGSLCLPKYQATQGSIGFYTPPPSPFNASLNHGDKNIFGVSSSNYARIMLQLGGILLVDNVVVKSINVSYPNTKGMIRHWYKNSMVPGASNADGSYLTPLLANVTINLCTVEAITANSYANMLWLKHQRDQGTFGADTQSFANSVIDNGKKIIDKTINTITNFYNNPFGGNNTKIS